MANFIGNYIALVKKWVPNLPLNQIKKRVYIRIYFIKEIYIGSFKIQKKKIFVLLQYSFNTRKTL